MYEYLYTVLTVPREDFGYESTFKPILENLDFTCLPSSQPNTNEEEPDDRSCGHARPIELCSLLRTPTIRPIDHQTVVQLLLSHLANRTRNGSFAFWRIQQGRQTILRLHTHILRQCMLVPLSVSVPVPFHSII